MLRAKPELEKIFNNDIDVDAAVGRYLFQVDPVIQHYRDRKLLSKTVIIHIGNNGGITDSQFDDMMKELKDVPRVLIVNLKVPRQWESNNNAVLARGAKRYPNTELVDWRAASIGHPEFFWDDAIHLRPEGATFYAKLLANRVKGR
jgi:hypothetical protein